MNEQKDRQYRSCAKWPINVSHEYPHNVSKDTHATEEQAEAVCSLLHRDGFGGERKIFPLTTWVEPV